MTGPLLLPPAAATLTRTSSRPATPSSFFPLPSPLPSPPISNTNDSSNTPLSILLRTETIIAHEQVMLPPFVALLTKGQLPSQLLLRYLLLLYSLYSALEDGLEVHSSHELLSTIYDPALLARKDYLERDIEYFMGGLPRHEWDNNQQWRQLQRQGLPEGVQGYVDRLKELAQDEEKATLLLGHAYVRYLGDLSGGQSIARSLRRAYSLPTTGEGSTFYEFFLPPGSPFSSSSSASSSGLPQRADLNETKRIKNWFRAGLDAAGDLMSEEKRREVCEEASRAFGWNMLLFESFTPLLPPSLLPSPSQAPPVIPLTLSSSSGSTSLPTPAPTPLRQRSSSPPPAPAASILKRRKTKLAEESRPPTMFPILPAVVVAIALAVFIWRRGHVEEGYPGVGI